MEVSQRLLDIKQGLSNFPKEMIECLTSHQVDETDVMVVDMQSLEMVKFTLKIIHCEFGSGNYKIMVTGIPQMKDEDFRVECIAYLYNEIIFDTQD